MRNHVEITWRDKLILKGDMSAVLSHELLQFMTKQFPGSNLPEIPTLDTIYNAFPGTIIRWEYKTADIGATTVQIEVMP